MKAPPEFGVRAVTLGDLPGLLALMAEHAAFERGEVTAKATQLSRALFEPPSRLFAWVAGDGADLLGYAAASCEFSAWQGRDYLHMDCLFVSAAARNHGLGARLVDAVTGFATAQGLEEVQWQTSAWNLDAVRFYERLGAVGDQKVRFSLDCAREARPA
ncbi:MAG: GNAT family N-acetyltransferase [Phenylobacterium sp.]|uniref:GNAT family N-acetyltransferase n=1 Tax=Phenylobacterium sp. TaxID=1871053 RepID=UPI00271CB588|nr:GNAT family N-acetyltransferase [Phenylobacterium sp.]MDO8913692.1 GNAT family N-acetyltransferase [Phenylobacterium sp.]MDP3099008.1 GNAT family N-acetyltransferase [Phenylobacterium sp.]